jgi:hypothetical protein
MKKSIYIIALALASASLLFNGCKNDDLDTLYPDPSKSTTASVENFLTGVLMSANEVVLPWYWRFFVVEQPTLGHYTHTMGWVNSKDQFIPPAAAMDWRWNQYYGTVTQFRVMEDLYNKLEPSAQEEYKIFMMAAKIFFYDQTQQTVDLFGDIPWTEAGKVRQLGNLDESLPKYDDAKTIYTTMLADLKTMADDFTTLSIPAFYAGLFQKKDFLNHGDVVMWQKYCNSLRLRILLRASEVIPTTEIGEILGNPTKYPVIESNEEATMLDEPGPDLWAGENIRSAMETWGQYDIAPFAMVKNMVDNGDPRLSITFDPNINGEYIGMDPLDNATVQNQKLTDGLISRYDTASFTQNNYFPGFIFSAAEVSFIKAEAYQKGFASGDAKAAYEKGIDQSIDLWYDINSTADFRAPSPRPTAEEISAYKASAGVSWDSNSDKINLIAMQKWLNTGLAQMPQTWAEYRRLDKPSFVFPEDPTSQQKVPPVRWLYPVTEKDLNGANYDLVKAQSDLNNRVFWDTK